MLGGAPGHQVGHAQMHRAAGKWVDKQMPALTRFQHLGQQRVWRRQRRPALLDLQQRLHAAQLGRVVAALPRQGKLLHHRVSQRAGQRHAPAIPARHGRAPARGAAHPGRHVVDANQLQQTPAKQKAVARLEARGKALFDRAYPCAAHVLHSHAGVAHDGADIHAVAARQPGVRHAPHALPVRYGTPVVGVGRQRRAAPRDKGQAPFPALTRQTGIGGRAAHLLIQGFGHKTAAQRDGDQVLHQHIQRLHGRAASLDMPGRNRGAGRSAFDHLDAVGRHQRDARRPARRVTRAAGSLQQPRYAFGRTDLQHPLDRQEINAQIQA